MTCELVFSESKLKYCVRVKISDGPHETPNFIERGIPFLSVDGIKKGEISLEKCRFISQEDHEKYNEKIKIEENDLLMGKAASIGKIARVKFNKPISVWSPLAVIKCDTDILNPSFLEYFLKSDFIQNQIQILATSNTQKNISMRDIERLKVLYPNKIEQNIISQYLDNKTQKINYLVEKIEKKIELLKEKRSALINQYVTKGLNKSILLRDSGVAWIGQIPKHWKLTKIKYLTSFNDEVLDEKTDPNYFFNYIEVGDVSFDKGINLKEKISFKSSPSRARRIVQSKDLIISTVRTYLKSISIVPDLKDLVCSTGFCVLRSKNKNLLPEYLSYFVKTSGFVHEVVKNSYGVSYPAINAIELTQFYLLQPPLDEQKKIVERISYLDNALTKIIQKNEEKVKLLNEYLQSLISSAVIGKIQITGEMI